MTRMNLEWLLEEKQYAMHNNGWYCAHAQVYRTNPWRAASMRLSPIFEYSEERKRIRGKEEKGMQTERGENSKRIAPRSSEMTEDRKRMR